jgi:Holliday junction resolvase
MATTPEKKVKDKVVAQLKKLGAYYFYPVTGGYGSSGVPDIVVCHRGRFIGIECKAGRNKPTKLQELNLKQIADAGGIALVINEENVNDVAHILGDIDDTNDTE